MRTAPPGRLSFCCFTNRYALVGCLLACSRARTSRLWILPAELFIPLSHLVALRRRPFFLVDTLAPCRVAQKSACCSVSSLHRVPVRHPCSSNQATIHAFVAYSVCGKWPCQTISFADLTIFVRPFSHKPRCSLHRDNIASFDSASVSGNGRGVRQPQRERAGRRPFSTFFFQGTRLPAWSVRAGLTSRSMPIQALRSRDSVDRADARWHSDECPAPSDSRGIERSGRHARHLGINEA